MSENIYYGTFTQKDKKQKIKEKIKSKFKDVKDFVIRNKEAVITLTPIVIGGIATTIKVVGKRINLHKEESLKDLHCYDRSLGHYWKLRRRLSTKEWLEVDRRKGNGERLADILLDMNVLK